MLTSNRLPPPLFPCSMDAAALCNKALERDLDAPPPASLLPEFERHLHLFPHDDEFLLELQPGSHGVGEPHARCSRALQELTLILPPTVTCMEKSCFTDIVVRLSPSRLVEAPQASA